MPDKTPLTQLPSAGGIVATHPATDLTMLAAPATDQQRNTLQPRIFPKACFRVEDHRFEFDSSFVRPGIREEMTNIARLIEDHSDTDPKTREKRKPPLSIFGHADPVGNDDYNKTLSGRRAQAVYAMLVRNTDLWEDLYAHPFGGDDWGLKSVQTMLEDLGYDTGGPSGHSSTRTTQAIKDFQTKEGLAADGVAGPKTRAVLFLRYMDHNCQDEKEQPYQLETTDFLGNGDDAGGKGDYQGCGEFNPLLMFSAAENQAFEHAADKTQRNSENAPNRRVTAFLYRPGLRVPAASWPCPRVKEGVAGCKKRFYANADQRRTFQDHRRTINVDKDTFACRFYDRMAANSPCEGILKAVLIRCFDPFKNPIAHAPYRLSLSGRTETGVADAGGWVVARDVKVPDAATIEFGYPADPNASPKPEPFLGYSIEIFLDIPTDDDDEAAQRRLSNLGYNLHPTLEENVKNFQRDYGKPQTGKLADIKDELNKFHDTAAPDPIDPNRHDDADLVA